jgi:hypothetical protein
MPFHRVCAKFFSIKCTFVSCKRKRSQLHKLSKFLIFKISIMTKKLFVSALALCAFTISISAQNAPTAATAAPVKAEAKVKKAAATTTATDAVATVKKPMNNKKAKSTKKATAKKVEKAATH